MRTANWFGAVFVLTMSCGLGACVGSIDGEMSTPAPATDTGQPAVGAGPEPAGLGSPVPVGASTDGCTPTLSIRPRLRRLGSPEYENTIRDLLRLEVEPDVELDVDPIVDGFRNNAAALVVSPVFAERAMRAASRFADEVVARFALLSGCGSTAVDGCARTFVKAFAQRAFRRPVSADEAATYQALYDRGRNGADAMGGVRLAVKTMLQSVHFLYRAEIGADPDAAAGSTPLGDWEIATALSYAIWGTMPDEALLAAAAAGKLRDGAGLESEARRLLVDRRARRQVRRFALEWLGLDDPARIIKDETLFPAFSDALRTDLLEEVQALTEDAFFGEAPALERLFVARDTLLNKRLAAFYGVTGPTSNDRFERVRLDPARRQGIFTSAGLLSAISDNRSTAPMTRGKFLLERVLCQELPPPPPELEIPSVGTGAMSTTRQRFELHGKNPTCAACHRKLDAVAFAFEHFDAIGRYRAAENGRPIDASGTLLGTADVDGPFGDGIEMLHRLAPSRTARSCLTDHFSRFVVGAASESCSVRTIADEVKRASGAPEALVLAVVRTRDFRWRRTR